MKINTITLLGALASANAGVIRGNTAVKKLAIMQKLTESVNKKSSGANRCQLAEEEQDNSANYQYQGLTEAEATKLTPGVCVTVSTKTNSYGDTVSTRPYMTFTTDTGVTYAASLSAYLSGIGADLITEEEDMCGECQTYQSYCEMDDKGKEEMAEMFKDMDVHELEEMADKDEMDDKYKEMFDNMDQHQVEEYMKEAEAYIEYLAVYGDDNDLCDSCEQSLCDGGHMWNIFCEQVNEYEYIGPTCGADGTTIELAVYSDADCTAMVPVSAYGYMENVGMTNYLMDTLLHMFTQPFYCAAYENNNGNAEPSACEELIEYSITENQCNSGNQYTDCEEIFEQQAALLNGSFMNAFTGKSYFDEGLSSGAIAGIAIAVIVVIVAGVALALKSKKKKSELEEPVFQGGSLS